MTTNSPGYYISRVEHYEIRSWDYREMDLDDVIREMGNIRRVVQKSYEGLHGVPNGYCPPIPVTVEGPNKCRGIGLWTLDASHTEDEGYADHVRNVVEENETRKVHGASMGYLGIRPYVKVLVNIYLNTGCNTEEQIAADVNIPRHHVVSICAALIQDGHVCRRPNGTLETTSQVSDRIHWLPGKPQERVLNYLRQYARTGQETVQCK